MKRIWLLGMTLVLCLMTFVSLAEERQSGKYKYVLKGNGTAEIVEYDGGITNDLYVPATIDGYTVTGIGDEAFVGKFNRTVRVVLPDSIKSIGSRAFWTEKITSINIPDSVQYIGGGAFAGCGSQFQIIISPSHPVFAVIDGSLYHKRNKELISGIGLTSIIIPEGIRSIGDYALSSTHLYWDVILPASLEKIGDYAFYRADVRSVYGLEGVKEYGEGAFKYICFELKDSKGFVEKGSDGGGISRVSMDYLGKECFYRADKLPEFLRLPDKIEEYVFFDSAMVVADVSNVKMIDEGNNSLGACYRDITDFNPELTVIPKDLFTKYCYIKELPETITTIESGAFSKVTDFHLHSSLSSIASDAFERGSTFVVEEGSYAEMWCQDNGFGYTYEGGEANLDWLNN